MTEDIVERKMKRMSNRRHGSFCCGIDGIADIDNKCHFMKTISIILLIPFSTLSFVMTVRRCVLVWFWFLCFWLKIFISACKFDMNWNLSWIMSIDNSVGKPHEDFHLPKKSTKSKRKPFLRKQSGRTWRSGDDYLKLRPIKSAFIKIFLPYLTHFLIHISKCPRASC